MFLFAALFLTFLIGLAIQGHVDADAGVAIVALVCSALTLGAVVLEFRYGSLSR